MAQPQTRAEIVARLDELDTAIQLYITDPVKFAKLQGGSVTIDIPVLVSTLREERERWQKRLDSLPWTVESDLEGTQ